MQESGRTSRLNMRIAPDALALVREAATRQQQDLSAFVLGAAMDRARAVLIDDTVIKLSPAAVAQMERALDSEPAIIPELAALLRQDREAAAS